MLITCSATSNISACRGDIARATQRNRREYPSRSLCPGYEVSRAGDIILILATNTQSSVWGILLALPSKVIWELLLMRSAFQQILLKKELRGRSLWYLQDSVLTFNAVTVRKITDHRIIQS